MEVWFTNPRNAQKLLEPSVVRAVEKLRRLPLAALRNRYQQQFGETRCWNRQFLFRRLAWQLQVEAEGDLSERTRQRAAEIATEADLRTREARGYWHWPEKTKLAKAPRIRRPPRDWRLPEPGTLLRRQYRGQEVVVKVLTEGFEYQAQHYGSLSAIARQVTGTQWNGFSFFGLTERRS